MPGGFNLSAFKSHLSKSWGHGPQRADGVLLLCTSMEPVKHLGSEAEVKTQLDGVVAPHTQQLGISLSSSSSNGLGGGGGGGVVMNSEEFLKSQLGQHWFSAQQIVLRSPNLKKDSRAGGLKYDAEGRFAQASSTLGCGQWRTRCFYVDGVLPAFDTFKARRFDPS